MELNVNDCTNLDCLAVFMVRFSCLQIFNILTDPRYNQLLIGS